MLDTLVECASVSILELSELELNLAGSIDTLTGRVRMYRYPWPNERRLAAFAALIHYRYSFHSEDSQSKDTLFQPIVLIDFVRYWEGDFLV